MTKSSRVTGSVGLGILAPTGSDSESGRFFSPSGEVDGPIDEVIQLGSAGWSLLLRAQGTDSSAALDILLDESLNPPRHVGADFVSYLILASCAHRF